MGGMGFIENNKAACMISVLINTNLLLASRDLGVERMDEQRGLVVGRAGEHLVFVGRREQAAAVTVGEGRGSRHDDHA